MAKTPVPYIRRRGRYGLVVGLFRCYKSLLIGGFFVGGILVVLVGRILVGRFDRIILDNPMVILVEELADRSSCVVKIVYPTKCLRSWLFLNETR